MKKAQRKIPGFGDSFESSIEASREFGLDSIASNSDEDSDGDYNLNIATTNRSSNPCSKLNKLEGQSPYYKLKSSLINVVGF